MFELPTELKTLTYQNQSIEFSYGIGEVIKTEKYTKTLVQGGGGGGTISTSVPGYTYGSIQSIYIESQSVVITDVWVKSDDGREVNCQLFNSNIGVREGHRVRFILGKGRSIEPPITVLLMNDTLGDGYTMNVGKAHFTLLDNPSGFLKNPKKKQAAFEEFVHQHTMKIAHYIARMHQA